MKEFGIFNSKLRIPEKAMGSNPLLDTPGKLIVTASYKKICATRLRAYMFTPKMQLIPHPCRLILNSRKELKFHVR